MNGKLVPQLEDSWGATFQAELNVIHDEEENLYKELDYLLGHYKIMPFYMSIYNLSYKPSFYSNARAR